MGPGARGVTDFLAFARDHGLIMSHVIADGRVHRVPTEAKPKRRNGAYAFDGSRGFVQDWTVHPAAIAFRGTAQTPPPRPIIAPLRDPREAEAAQQVARDTLARCVYQTHPYLARKGFAAESWLVDPTDGRLVVPMYDAKRYSRLLSVQRIAPDGTKMFLRGGIAKDAVYHLGRGPEDVLVEGLATALSVRAALASLYRQARVVVCFSAGNLAAVARHYRGMVVADNDASGTGEAAAKKTGMRYVMPPDVGTDANDLHQQRGIEALRKLLM